MITVYSCLFNAEFELNCSVAENRIFTVRCDGTDGVIDEVVCIYDADFESPGAVREMC